MLSLRSMALTLKKSSSLSARALPVGTNVTLAASSSWQTRVHPFCLQKTLGLLTWSSAQSARLLFVCGVRAEIRARRGFDGRASLCRRGCGCTQVGGSSAGRRRHCVSCHPCENAVRKRRGERAARWRCLATQAAMVTDSLRILQYLTPGEGDETWTTVEACRSERGETDPGYSFGQRFQRPRRRSLFDILEQRVPWHLCLCTRLREQRTCPMQPYANCSGAGWKWLPATIQHQDLCARDEP